MSKLWDLLGQGALGEALPLEVEAPVEAAPAGLGHERRHKFHSIVKSLINKAILGEWMETRKRLYALTTATTG